MGAGIALVFARAGSQVALHARRRSTLERARARIREVKPRVLLTRSLERAVRDAELVVESVIEDPVTKRSLLARVEQLAPEGTLLATNTSSLPIAELASVLERPGALAGMHWFNPPELVDLVEIVAGPATAPEATATLAEWAVALGKTPVVVRRDVPGFVANRLQYALIREAYGLVAAGVATYADVDAAVRSGLGPRWAAVGPFESMDLAGLDVHQEVARRLFPTLSNDREPPPDLMRLVADGNLGTKTRHGLRGRYSSAAVAALEQRRASVLRALSDMRPVDSREHGA
jgi:3-hydroxybutyryl-CoA dehydrogenase